MTLYVCDAGHLRTNKHPDGDTCAELVYGGVGGRLCGRACSPVSDHANALVTMAVAAHQREHGAVGVHVLMLDIMRDLGWPGAGSWKP